MNRDTPQPGERWRHFKGGEYVVIVIAIAPVLNAVPISVAVVYSKVFTDKSKLAHSVKVFDTESNKVFWATPVQGDETAFVLTPSDETWTESDKTDETIWARPLDNFMGVVSGDEGTNYYRFERIKGYPPIEINEPVKAKS